MIEDKDSYENTWPANAKVYVTARRIKATMPKLGRGRFCIPKPVKPVTHRLI